MNDKKLTFETCGVISYDIKNVILFKKALTLYQKTASLLVVLAVLTASILYVLFGTGYRQALPDKSKLASTFKVSVEFDIQSKIAKIREIEAISERILSNTKLAGDSAYEIIILDQAKKNLYQAKVWINERIAIDQSKIGKNEYPQKIPTNLYLPYYPNASEIVFYKDGSKISSSPIPQSARGLATPPPSLVSEIASGQTRIAIIGDGLSSSAFQSAVSSFKSSIANVQPFGDTSTLFDFIPYEGTGPLGCTSEIISCITSPAMQAAMQQAMSSTGASGVVVLSNGGGISASMIGLPGPSVINTNNSMAFLGIHEFLGHMIGKLNDRYNNCKIPGAACGIGLTPSNCSTNPNGESWWGQAGSTGAYLGCETPNTYAPFPNDPACPDGGNKNTVMANCTGASLEFDSVERYWISNFILPNLGGGGGGGSLKPPPGGGVNVQQPVLQNVIGLSCTNGAWKMKFSWTPARINGSLPQQQNIDIKFDDGTSFGTDNFVGSEPLAGNQTTYKWPGIKANQKHRWRVNALYNGNWYGFETESVFTTGACGTCEAVKPIADCGVFCHSPGDQPAGAGCCDGAICASGNCVNNVCVAQPPTPTQSPPTPTRPPTPTATTRPLPTPTSTPSPGQPTATPTVTTGPTPTIAQNESRIALELRLSTVGPNTALGQNPNPVRPNQQIQIQIFNVQGEKIKDATGSLTFNASNHAFMGIVSIGTDLPSGVYTIKVRFNNTLFRAITAQLNSGQTTNLPSRDLISGDIDQNNELNLVDYNLLISCYGERQCAQKELADLNLDGKVDEKDLNIMLAGFANRQGD